MKRIISFLVVAMTVIAACSLTSCTKDEAKSSDSLSGTTWVADAIIVKATIKFTSDTKVKYSTEMAGTPIVEMEGTYTYSKPTVTLKMSYQGQSATLVGTISGNTLSMTEEGETVVYTKQ